MKTNDSALRRAIDAFLAGRLNRRSFIRRVGAAGFSAAVAGSLASAYAASGSAESAKPDRDGSSKARQDYDYVIVGAGSAGAALAYRLATTTEARVLLLEAGGPADLPEIHDPAKWPQALQTRAAKWFTIVKQAHLDNRVLQQPRGNVVGGSSCLNAMIYARGHPSDFDSWSHAGCAGWDYDSVLPHYIALENYQHGALDEPQQTLKKYRGSDGPLAVTRPQPAHRSAGGQKFIDASKALGYSENADNNGARMDGPTWVNFTIKDRHRESTAVAFVHPVMDRPNFDLLTGARALDLVWENGRCAGVRYRRGRQTHIVRAGQEVVLSTGAFDTPRLLMLSGIGPGDDLRALGIEPKVALPGVGQNLQDQLLTGGPTFESPGPMPTSYYNFSEVYMWARSRDGLVAPDLCTLYLGLPFISPAFSAEVKHGWTISGGLMRPTSRGTLKLKSKDYRDKPRIDPNYLATQHDRDLLSKATEIALATAHDPAFADIRKKQILPDPKIKVGSSAWHEFIAKSAHTFYHPTSTCKMGVDSQSVVDPKLRVYDVPSLRVADASIMPTITSGNTNAPSIMIGWKCAEMIRAARS